MQRSQIFVQNLVFCLPHLHSTPPLGGSSRNIAIPFGTEKLERLGYTTVKKKFEDMFIRFHMIHERDRHTDRQTHRQTQHADIGRAYALHRAAKI